VKNNVMNYFSSAALLVAMISPVGAAAPKVRQPAIPAQSQEDKRESAKGERERHPEIRAAIRALERTKKHLQDASHDFGGHRAEALESVDNAIKQLRQALQFDKE
jgi:hypothetical protein